MKTKDQTLIKEAVDLMKKTKSIEYAKNKSEVMIQKAWDDLYYQMP
jgi:hypothetical protein